MEDDNNTVSLGIKAVFAVLALAGFAAFALYRSNLNSTAPSGSVLMWGTIPSPVMNSVGQSISQRYDKVRFKYVRKDPETYVNDLKDAFAAGVGPDIFLLNSADLLDLLPVSYVIPKDFYTKANFLRDYSDGAEVFYTQNGAASIPLMIDPIIMYYNKDLLKSMFLVDPPKTWDEVMSLTQEFNVFDENGQIKRSVIALGTTNNINNATDIISALILQTGNPIIQQASNADNIKYEAVLTKYPSYPTVFQAIKFYTSFASPNYYNYSWNNSSTDNLNSFASERLLLYLGYGSEYRDIIRRNQFLNLGTAIIPQFSDNNITTYANVWGISLYKNSPNFSSAYAVASLLASDEFAKYIATSVGAYPAKRSILNDTNVSDEYTETIRASAVIAKTYPRPDKTKIDRYIKDTIRSVLSTGADDDRLISKYVKELESNIQAILNTKNELVNRLLNPSK